MFTRKLLMLVHVDKQLKYSDNLTEPWTLHVRLMLNQVMRNAPTTCASQWDCPSNYASNQGSAVTLTLPAPYYLLLRTSSLSDHGYQTIRNHIFSLLCIPHSHHTVYRLAGAASCSRVPAHGEWRCVRDSSCTSSLCCACCFSNDSFPRGSWEMCWSGTLLTSRTPWWRSLPSGLSPSFSARPWSSCRSSP